MTPAHVRALYGVDVDVVFDQQARHLMVVGMRRPR
jgi:hypothetical protein